ncbi:Hypothetical predicted protein [Cloeon dipterum]|uniref:Uncharacterized protein n=1 Tax=Cloeon dipterum TaxID=197152 RepID=A0A8S1DU51_9INSE|nr:Hypothetical predicted protein [Cloeon dipterum]
MSSAESSSSSPVSNLEPDRFNELREAVIKFILFLISFFYGAAINIFDATCSNGSDGFPDYENLDSPFENFFNSDDFERNPHPGEADTPAEPQDQSGKVQFNSSWDTSDEPGWGVMWRKFALLAPCIRRPAQQDEKCVYCGKIFRTKTFRILTKSEANIVPRLCPWHHNIYSIRTYYREPQNPNLICGTCTVYLRLFQRLQCHCQFHRAHHFCPDKDQKMSSKRKQSVSSAQSLRDKISSAAHYLWALIVHCETPTKAESEDTTPVTFKRCVYCPFMFNANHGITPFTEAEAELLTKMCPYHHNKDQPRIIHSKPQDPGQICGLCTLILRYYMQRCIFTGKLSDEPQKCFASVNTRPRRGSVFANSDEELNLKENDIPSASFDEDYDDV